MKVVDVVGVPLDLLDEQEKATVRHSGVGPVAIFLIVSIDTRSVEV